jgi:primosomal protein N' (replication factor Y) (superfamily II helicase)
MTELLTLHVAVDTPQHTGLTEPLSYTSEHALPPGTLVRVPLGRRELPGVVWRMPPRSSASNTPNAVETVKLRPITTVMASLPPLGEAWLALVDFAVAYYQRNAGELAMSALPPELRKLDDAQLANRIKKLHKSLEKPLEKPLKDAANQASENPAASAIAHIDAKPPALTPEQAAALAQIARPDAVVAVVNTVSNEVSNDVSNELSNSLLNKVSNKVLNAKNLPVLLHGVTGSGKTEVYLGAAAQALAAGQQALILVPEINLTPQLEARFAERFGGHHIVSMHSALTPAQRLRSWLAAHLGLADLVLGTRLAVFASMPRLGLIVVDEEHDPSYKQQDGARYSARDLAVYRAQLEGVKVLLGSATPSLESWQRAEQGRYRKLTLAARIGGGALPMVRLVNMTQQPKSNISALSPPLMAALQERIARGEQSLVFLNRRGFAPVLHCGDCGWKSACAHCSAWRVFHKIDRTLRCHHCGLTDRVPRACPDCGNLDIAPLGRGTEQLEEQLSHLLRTPDDQPARIARIDADTTRLKGSLQAQLGAVHAGEVDVLVGTQMLTKGHDFRRITLVAAVNPDGMLFSSDFRAPERLFSLLMQAGGRAGRDAAQAERSEMWVQTWHPQHALYQALRSHDFEAFAASQLQERRTANLPPYSHLALLRADARTAQAATHFLQAACDLAHTLSSAEHITLYSPVPLTIARVADVERMQMLLESNSRPALQRFLRDWLPTLHTLRHQPTTLSDRILRWAVDVDPALI